LLGFNGKIANLTNTAIIRSNFKPFIMAQADVALAAGVEHFSIPEKVQKQTENA